MSYIIYSEKVEDTLGNVINKKLLKETFAEAIEINNKLSSNHKRVAYFFIDPLLDTFEAANKFYFGVIGCSKINKINTYRSGASPIQALTDAKELLDHNMYDAVFIFGNESLRSDKINLGKEEINKAMHIFQEKSLLECYNLLAYEVSKKIGVTSDEFKLIADKLYDNYSRTYAKTTNEEVSRNRGKSLVDSKADLFKLTDCANPNIDFSGGVILANKETAEFLQQAEGHRIRVSGAAYRVVEGLPDKLDTIVGNEEVLFPHLVEAFSEAELEAGIKFVEEYKNNNLLLEAYTCYPPIPIALIFATGMVQDSDEIIGFLDRYEITITGGMNFARAPWNNPALNGLIEMHKKMKKDQVTYGLVHGNGGIGELQGVAFLERVE